MTEKILILLVIVSLSGCGFGSGDTVVDARKSEYYYYTSSKKDVVYKYKQSVTGIQLWWSTPIRMDADVGSFIVLSRSYAKDKNNVFFKGVKVTNADVASFTSDETFTRDKYHVFTNDFSDKEKGILNIIEGANPDKYIKINSGWAKDDSHYYYFDEKIDVDVQTFRFLSGDVGIDKNTIYYIVGKPSLGYGKSYHYTGEVRPVIENIFHDDNKIYNFRKKPVSVIPVNSPATIHVVDSIRNIVFFVDKTMYWNMEERDASNIDIATFKCDGDYATDKNRIYYSGIEIKGADVRTFSKISESFSKDKNHVYYRSNILPEADPPTFRYVAVKNESGYYQDKNYKWKYSSGKKKWEIFH
ncbi:DKNYY domain-containing protein [Dysgonomonas macrotermitis]|nr:DKNYY domain-containing protein [Dysgonomonas macrotermitis]